MKRPYVLVLRALSIERAPDCGYRQDRRWTISLLVDRLNRGEDGSPYTRHVVEGALRTLIDRGLAEYAGGKWNVRHSKVLALAEKCVGDSDSGADWREIAVELRRRGVVVPSQEDVVLQALQALGYRDGSWRVRHG